jgi:signal transduction histidine kinase
LKEFHNYLQQMKKAWQKIFTRSSIGDISFFMLRLATILGGIVWLSLAPMSPDESTKLIKALIAFSAYSILLYLFILGSIGRLSTIYVTSLLLDLLFVFTLVNLQVDFTNSFFLGYYMLTALHSFYFGVGFGLFVAVVSCFLYFLNIQPLLGQIHWTDLGLRMVFLFPIAIPLGLLSQNLRKKTHEIGRLNMELENSLENLTRMQEKLVEHEKLSALGRFTADVAHEIRNPLTSLGGIARRLEKRLPGGTKEKKYSELIVNESTRLESVLRDVLAYSEKEENHLERHDLNIPVAEAAPFFCDTCHEKRINLVENYAEDLPQIYMHPDHVKQAVGNIIINAVEAMEQGGTLTITTGMENENGIDWLTVTISDTGEGVPQDSLAYIFEPFHSTKKTGVGTGLGLPISHKIMEEHRGFIRVDSELGKGSRFKLFFPYQSEAEDQETPCWEYLGCGIEKDTTRNCPAYPYFGRICYGVAGTDCEHGVSGIYASKIEECTKCPFYQELTGSVPVH